MAFSAILRRSVARLAPVGAQIVRSQKQRQSSVFSALYRHASSPVMRPAFGSLSQIHHFSSPAAVKRTSSDENLLRVIEAEIQCAIEAEDQDKVEEAPDNFPFEIEDNPGEQTISLSRTYQGETINVVVHMPDIVSGEGAEDNEDDDNDDETENGTQSSIPLVVRISKKDGPSLEFGCTAFPDEIAIDTLAVKDPNASEEQVAYEGPDFADLDENLQKAFHKYLEIRGIKPSTTNFLHEYMISKDSREYLMWLKNLKSFVEA
uniref:Mitochondrial glycoprotein n=1 Tax=Kalanchoe fedtschenkoi TaxID=63787 RepID=A0A7N0V3B9_KALFE